MFLRHLLWSLSRSCRQPEATSPVKLQKPPLELVLLSQLCRAVLDLIGSNLLEIDDGEAAALSKAGLVMLDAFFTSRCFGGVSARRCALFLGGVPLELCLREDDRLEHTPTEDRDAVRPRVSGMMV